MIDYTNEGKKDPWDYVPFVVMGIMLFAFAAAFWYTAFGPGRDLDVARRQLESDHQAAWFESCRSENVEYKCEQIWEEMHRPVSDNSGNSAVGAILMYHAISGIGK